MPQTVALVTNVTQYAGPAGATALAADGFRAGCHVHGRVDVVLSNDYAPPAAVVSPFFGFTGGWLP